MKWVKWVTEYGWVTYHHMLVPSFFCYKRHWAKNVCSKNLLVILRTPSLIMQIN